MGIQWRDSLNIGVEVIDDQHKELFRRFDLFLTACETGEGAARLGFLLEFLADYVQQHFHDEEELHRLHIYDRYEEHRQEHGCFIEDFKKMQQEVGAEGVALHHVIDANTMLFKWIVNHISISDKAFGEFIRKQVLPQ